MFHGSQARAEHKRRTFHILPTADILPRPNESACGLPVNAAIIGPPTVSLHYVMLMTRLEAQL